MSAIRQGWSTLLEAEPLLLLARCSLLVVLVNSHGEAPVVFVALGLACAVALPNPRVMVSPWLWTALFVGLGARQLSGWTALDDHIVASTYWCGALALGLAARDPRSTLAASARLLIGSLFAFAAVWKLGSGEFINGRFFRYSLLFDDRFRTIAHLVGGTSHVVNDANRDATQALVDNSTTGHAIALREGTRNVGTAWMLTLWGAFIETAVALTFLVPLRRRSGWMRHAALVTFACTTYLIVPVGGFGVFLLVLGSAMADTPHGRRAYVVGAAVLAAWAGISQIVSL